ncbi:MurNAc alpha-1-phosphate uridylyltransferase [Sphingomonas laterariae]|uniref:MurNAc alpha-1-phosphate uridylyltransferase n=1 Tax=Edaphosphingomonas laterariae TaxID=861865 RepID=A0A239JRV7_9SPHN|nr:nucleotidyltransferase family protein [Sphingomonas laterariae]SNT08499.1 MurNAc alpha-1-phosphate uridylyltransferase [Sphingomonas laterariae]
MTRYRKPLAIRPNSGGAPVRTAMVMAAGLGKRMRPLTATRPKPLVEVAGKPLLDHALDRLRSAGVRRAVVNVHYLADALEAHLRRKAGDMEIIVSDERAELLETGGGTVKALPLIEDDHFLVVNSDNLWVDGPVDAIRLLGQRWDDAKMDALLLVVPQARAHCHSGPGDFHMDADGLLSRRRPGKVAPFVFTGIQLVSRRLFADAPEGPFSTNILWDRAIAAGRAYGVVHQGLWFDVGTPGAIARTEALLAAG